MSSLISKFLLYARTISHLKTSQILARIIFILKKPKLSLSSLPKKRANKEFEFTKNTESSVFSINCYKFLNMKKEHNLSELWHFKSLPVLWLYNLHYFNFLNSSSEKKNSIFLQIIDNWIEMNPPGNGVGWDSYPLSLRIVNFIKWDIRNNSLDKKQISSLAIQTRYLYQRIEYHIEGNHLIANAKALIFAGYYFEGEESDFWLKKGQDILLKALEEQILADGGHYERSVMYHAIVLEDLLDIEMIIKEGNRQYKRKISFINSIRLIIKKMFYWLEVMTHPDGEISFFNDSAMNIASKLDKLKKYATRLNHSISFDHERFIYLKESGYIRIENQDIVMIIDVAPIGPDFLPAHAHADTLSYELSLQKQRIIVNSGISNYENNNQRQYERSTAAHSTVEIDYRNSSEVWHKFRVARRAYPSLISTEITEDYIKIVATHNGYDYLNSKPKHMRSWIVCENSIRVEDSIRGQDNVVISRHFLHPNISHDKKQRLLHWNNKKITVNANNGNFSLINTEWFRGFGDKENNKCIKITPEFRNSEAFCFLELSW